MGQQFGDLWTDIDGNEGRCGLLHAYMNKHAAQTKENSKIVITEELFPIFSNENGTDNITDSKLRGYLSSS